MRLAWAESGSGPVIVKAANWLTHLDQEWDSPVWRHWLAFFTEHFRFIRYDERGCGMADWDPPAYSFDAWVSDLESVIDAAAPQEPFTLLGISQGASVCIAYAVRHPERVARLILYGGYARGWATRPNPETQKEYNAIIDLIRVGWGRDNPTFRQLFTSRFIPGGTDEQLGWFNDLCLKTTSAANAAEILKTRGEIDVTALLERVTVPTLVIHARKDAVVTIAEGRLIASMIPDAQFVELDSGNHIMLDGEPAWERFQEVVLDFMGSGKSTQDEAFASLSPREREILALISNGLGNAGPEWR